jgi:hypothetical protein
MAPGIGCAAEGCRHPPASCRDREELEGCAWQSGNGDHHRSDGIDRKSSSVREIPHACRRLVVP